MKKFVFIILTSLLLTSCMPERIDAGYEGILVELYGSDRGVNDVSMVTGMIWYNIFTQTVFEYPTFVQTVDYPEFTTNAKDGSEFTIDPSINIYIEQGKAPQVFKKYRKTLEEVIDGPIYKHIKDACRIEINKFTTDEIVSNREAVEDAIETRFKELIKDEGFILDQFTPGLKYPEAIVSAVDAKNKAVQEAQRAANEVLVAEAEAKKLVVAAQAEAEANRLRTQALTPAVLQQMWINKWDGHVPTMITGGGTSTFIDLSKLK